MGWGWVPAYLVLGAGARGHGISFDEDFCAAARAPARLGVPGPGHALSPRVQRMRAASQVSCLPAHHNKRSQGAAGTTSAHQARELGKGRAAAGCLNPNTSGCRLLEAALSS